MKIKKTLIGSLFALLCTTTSIAAYSATGDVECFKVKSTRYGVITTGHGSRSISTSTSLNNINAEGYAKVWVKDDNGNEHTEKVNSTQTRRTPTATYNIGLLESIIDHSHSYGVYY